MVSAGYIPSDAFSQPRKVNNMKNLLVIVLCSVITGTTINAQHISAGALKPLDFMIGEWNVEVDARLSKQGPWEQSKGHSTIVKIVGGSVIQDQFTGTKQGRELTSVAMLANDNRTKLYQKVFVDSDHGMLLLYEGKLEGKLLSLFYKFNLNGVDLTLRSQYNLIAENEFTVESARSTDNGVTWDRTGTMRYTR
jgi:hypothetical protein